MAPRRSPFSESLCRAFRVLPALAAGALAVGLAGAAEAKPEYAEAIFETLGTACPAPCTICHYSPTGGEDSVRGEGFLVTFQMVAGNNLAENIPAALEFMETRPCLVMTDPGCQPDPADATMACTGVCDADGDGTGDVAELRQGTNPNDSTAFACPEYGCGVAPARTGRSVNGAALLVALAGALAFGARLKRRY